MSVADPEPCQRCGGCKQIANSDDGEPWTVWEELPPGSDLAAPVWRIMRVTWNGDNNPTAVEWATASGGNHGDNLYRHVWNDRAGLSYS